MSLCEWGFSVLARFGGFSASLEACLFNPRLGIAFQVGMNSVDPIQDSRRVVGAETIERTR